jgi:hypothetical protein
MLAGYRLSRAALADNLRIVRDAMRTYERDKASGVSFVESLRCLSSAVQAHRHDGMAPPAKPKRVRRLSITTQATQLLRAADKVGLVVAVTVEGGRVTATPVTLGAAHSNDINEWDRDLGCSSPETRQ